MFYVRKMIEEDFEFAAHLTDTMSWNLVEEDFKFMLELEPDGCFVLLDDSKKVGILTAISFGQLAWLGNIIVSESYRERGAGSLLVKHSINHFKSKGVQTFGLYSYINRIPFYRRLGFNYDSEFLVLRGKGSSSQTKASIREAGIDEIAFFDRQCFGLSRRKLLESILLDPDNLCYISIEEGHVEGFIVAKVYGETAEVGPLICQYGRSDVAIDLLKAVLNRLNGFEVTLCIPEKESIILNVLMESGFKESFRVARMYYGQPIIKDFIYIAESLERG